MLKCPEVRKGNGAEQDMHRQGVNELAVANECSVRSIKRLVDYDPKKKFEMAPQWTERCEDLTWAFHGVVCLLCPSPCRAVSVI